MAEQGGKIVNQPWTLFIGLFIIIMGVKQFWNCNINRYDLAHEWTCFILLEGKYKPFGDGLELDEPVWI